MPELPEVETIRRGLLPLLVGRRFVGSGSHPSAKFLPATQVVGAVVQNVDRRGKYLLLALDDRRRMVLHLGMTGQLGFAPIGDPLDPYARAWWHLDDDRTLVFRDVRRFGRIAVVGAGRTGPAALAALGPEPFDPAFTAEGLWLDLRGSRVRVKTQLLGQRVVAGIGNIYADEALWRAGIHPASRRVSRPAAGRLHQAIVTVLDEAIRHGGTTLRDYRTVDGGSGRNQHRLDCYGRAGQPCRRCGQALGRMVLDGRSTTSCSSCQRR
ncbi:MAG: bifunctional DNA-formamidopyrimidine glycosylase/DNA-(apurinic or apyrimidinic site) lyase [Acidimicrobiales bacterium]